MVTKKITAGDLQNAANTLFTNWETSKNDIHLSSVQMYRLISLKKKLQEEAVKLSETVTALAEQAGGERLSNGGIKIPDDKIAQVNEDLAKLSDEIIDFEYSPIQVTENDNIPISIMEPLMEFIEIQE